jgi:diguanylate cyclase (GGDEF)-like protein
MTLDVRTIVIVLLVSQVLMSATLLLDLRSGRAPGLRRWNLGLGLFALGWLLIVLRALLPPLVGIGVADALLLAGLCLQYGALLEFGGRPVPGWLAPGAAAALFVALLPLLDHYAALTLLSSVVYASVFVALAAVTIRLGDRAGPVRWLSAAILIVGGVALIARAVDIWLRPGETPAMFTGSALHGFAFIMLLAITVSSSFSFLVMQRRAAEAKVRHIAMYDGLTELYNRRAFLEIAEREAARARRAAAPTAALMLDLDHFKRVNDAHGHASGDRVLVDFAERLRAAVRSADILGRYGGEEFCVLLPGATIEEASDVAERIRAAVVAKPLGGLAEVTTVSTGVAGSARSDCSVDELLAQADAALYRAKRSGRNKVLVHARRAVAA